MAGGLIKYRLAPPFEKGRRGRDLKWANFSEIFKSPLAPFFKVGGMIPFLIKKEKQT